MLVGYLSFFIFLRFFETHTLQFERLLNELYWLTLVLLMVCVAQFVFRKQILFGLYREYGTVMRFLPIMLPFCLLHTWRILSKALRLSPISWHQGLYAALSVGVLILTFTRGLYFAFLAALAVGIVVLAFKGRLKAAGVVATSITLAIALGVVGALGGLELASARLKSGAEILTAKPSAGFGRDADTFTGRLRLAEERFVMVAERNPIVGYGFLNEDNVWPQLRNSLKAGSIIYSPAMVEAYRFGHPYVLALHSADISWGDLALNTGFVGVAIFLIFVAAILVNYLRNEVASEMDNADWRFAFFAQILVTLISTLNGNPIIVNVQIFAFMLAGLAFTSARKRELRRKIPMNIESNVRRQRVLA